MDDSGRLIVYSVWAVGSVVVWGRVFINALVEYLDLPDAERRARTAPDSRLTNVRARARREVISDFALLMVGVFAAGSLFSLVLGPEVTSFRGFVSSLALGAFLGAGLVRWK